MAWDTEQPTLPTVFPCFPVPQECYGEALSHPHCRKSRAKREQPLRSAVAVAAPVLLGTSGGTGRVLQSCRGRMVGLVRVSHPEWASLPGRSGFSLEIASPPAVRRFEKVQIEQTSRKICGVPWMSYYLALLCATFSAWSMFCRHFSIPALLQNERWAVFHRFLKSFCFRSTPQSCELFFL